MCNESFNLFEILIRHIIIALQEQLLLVKSLPNPRLHILNNISKVEVGKFSSEQQKKREHDTFEEHEQVTKSQVASEEEAESPLKKVKLEKDTNRTPIPCLNLPPPEESDAVKCTKKMKTKISTGPQLKEKINDPVGVSLDDLTKISNAMQKMHDSTKCYFEKVVEIVNKEENDNSTAEIFKDGKDDDEPVKDNGEPVNVKPEGK
uniref:Uncharacterized protein n=1 Tax=Cannabis sativa TaxID=3483 RepID=A0A803P5L4_CANSA